MFLLQLAGGRRGLNVDEATTDAEDVVGRGYLLDSDDLGDSTTSLTLESDPDAKQDDSDDEWPLFVRGTGGGGARLKLRLYADDPTMDAAGPLGGCSGPRGRALIEQIRHRDPRGCEEVLPLLV